jgi:hypothetical protein
MNVYKIKVASDEYKELCLANVYVSGFMRNQPRAEPFKSSWRLVEFRYTRPNTEGYQANAIDSDFISLNGDLGMSAATAERTSEWFLPYGELLPVTVVDNGSTAYWFHCTTLVDALDEQNSIGTIEDNGRMRNPSLFVFFPEKIKDSSIFVIPQLGTGVYCTDQLKTLVDASGLTGLSFVLEWSDEPNGIAQIEAWKQKAGYLKGIKERMLKKRAELEAGRK